MGTCYMIVDEEGRNALDIGKCYALWWVASGKTNTSQARDGAGHPVTAAMIQESAQGWLMSNPERYVGTDMAELAERQDVAFSSRMAAKIERWQREIAGGRDLRIYEEGDSPCGGDMDPKVEWGTLYTLYVHPVTREAAPPFRLFPLKRDA